MCMVIRVQSHGYANKLASIFAWRMKKKLIDLSCSRFNFMKESGKRIKTKMKMYIHCLQSNENKTKNTIFLKITSGIKNTHYNSFINI